jgi:hypothetical protein
MQSNTFYGVKMRSMEYQNSMLFCVLPAARHPLGQVILEAGKADPQHPFSVHLQLHVQGNTPYLTEYLG